MRAGGAVAAGVLAASTWIGAAAPPPKAPKPPANDDCLACHDDPSAKRADGRSISVGKDAFAASVHGAAGAACVDCHTDLAKAVDFPHAEKLAPVDCSPCHGSQAADYDKSVHAAAREKPGRNRAARCVDCHGSHEIRPSKDPASATNHFNLPATCLKCHGGRVVVPGAAGEPPENLPARFEDSIHGKALEKSGLKFAPNCTTCHGTHDIRRPESDPASPVFRTKVPGTCGSCHSKILGQYDESAHGTALAKGEKKAPVCSDCHTAHGITDAKDVRRLQILKECGSCHEESLRTYRDTYHGQVTALGFSLIATCADCHTPHHVFPTADPRSTVSAANRLTTCQKCHAGVGANFARYDPHADPENRSRNPLLHFAALFMRWLLVFVFAFFGIHTLLWFPRSVRARQEAGRRNGGES